MIRNSVRILVVLSQCAVTVGLEAKTTDYGRAKALAKADPVEAEALYERFMRDTSWGKMRRAAHYDLFYLRLRNGRLAEAFPLSDSIDLGRKYRRSLADFYGISEGQASKLVRRLHGVCSQEEEASHAGRLLRSEMMPAPVWDFALRVLLRCRTKGRSQLFSSDLFEIEKPTRLQTQLRLIAIREQLYADADKAQKLFAIARAAAEAQYGTDEQLKVQLIVLEARIAAAQEDFDRVIELCGEIPADSGMKQARTVCALLTAHALLKKGEAEKAWKKIRNIEINPSELDTRLLRLTIAVAADVEESQKLAEFTRRVSYSYCAKSLRELAAAVLAEKTNKR